MPDLSLYGWNAQVGEAAFWIAALRIVVINILLSGDNAVVIAMACRGLPRRQKLWGMAIGAGTSVTLLIVFSDVVAQLIEFPYLKAAGGLALFYIAAKLLLPDEPHGTEVHAEAHLWHAVRIVVVADIIMSFDNVIAVATAAKGNLALLAIGLAASIPIIIAGAAVVMALLERLPILVWIGSALLGWVGGEAVVTDRAIAALLTTTFTDNVVHELQWAASAAGIIVVLAAGALWRRCYFSKRQAAAD